MTITSGALLSESLGWDASALKLLGVKWTKLKLFEFHTEECADILTLQLKSQRKTPEAINSVASDAKEVATSVCSSVALRRCGILSRGTQGHIKHIPQLSPKLVIAPSLFIKQGRCKCSWTTGKATDQVYVCPINVQDQIENKLFWIVGTIAKVGLIHRTQPRFTNWFT